jgi:hypothetical protein
MADESPPALWATASLACSTLGCLGALVWLVGIARPPVETTGVSAGLGIALVGLPAFTLCALGVILGVVSVGRTRSGGCLARTGLVLGWLPFAVFFAGSVVGLWRLPG